MLHEKPEFLKALEIVKALELHLRWFSRQEKTSHRRVYNEKHIVSSSVWQASNRLEEESGLPGKKLGGLQSSVGPAGCTLTVWLSQEAVDGWRYGWARQRGAQFYYSALAIETALTFGTLFNLPLHQTQGFVQSLLGLMGLNLPALDYSTLSRRQAGLAVDLPVKPTGQPIHLVVDSTGLKVYGESEWKVRQHGWTQRRTWRKLHLGIDRKSTRLNSSHW